MNLLDQIPSGQFTVPAYLEYLATFTWATSGAIVGVRLRCDVVGVFVLALVSSMGAGLIRDGLFLQRTPAVLINGAYLLLVFLAVVLIVITQRKVFSTPMLTPLRKAIPVRKVVDLIDAFGTPAFAIVGMQMALAAHAPYPGVLLIGVINGVGGGVLRDILSGQPVLLLQPGQFSSLLVLVACAAFILLTQWQHFDSTRIGLLTIVLFFVTRMLTIRYNWRTRAVLLEDAKTSASGISGSGDGSHRE